MPGCPAPLEGRHPLSNRTRPGAPQIGGKEEKSRVAFEKKVKESLESRVAAFSLQEQDRRVLIPTEDVVEVRGGRRLSLPACPIRATSSWKWISTRTPGTSFAIPRASPVSSVRPRHLRRSPRPKWTPSSIACAHLWIARSLSRLRTQ